MKTFLSFYTYVFSIWMIIMIHFRICIFPFNSISIAYLYPKIVCWLRYFKLFKLRSKSKVICIWKFSMNSSHILVTFIRNGFPMSSWLFNVHQFEITWIPTNQVSFAFHPDEVGEEEEEELIKVFHSTRPYDLSFHRPFQKA